jgi:hypothetical protein
MNRNYIVAPTINQIGFLKNQNSFRAKQGLASQDLAGTCQQPSKSSGLYNLNTGDYCAADNMYFTRLTRLNYGDKNVPNDCPCARFVQAP